MKFIKNIVFFFMLMLFVYNPSFAMGQLTFTENTQEGKKAQDFTLKNLKGDEVNMTKFRDGKKAVLFFWATWCPHCREQLTQLNEQASAIEQKGIKIILVDIGEPAELVREHVFRNKIAFEVLLDENNSVSEEYGIIGVPTFYFINKDGMVNVVEHALPENYDEILSK